jgi:hypothetical protein
VRDDRVVERLESPNRTTLVGRFGPQTQVREGDTVEVAVDAEGLHFFDASTGRVIHDDTSVPVPV